MKNYLNYKDMVDICNEINEQHIPSEDAFLNKIDELFEHTNLEGKELILYSFKELLKVVDSEINNIEKKVNISPSCEKGCANCCYFPIITTKLEAKLMIGVINRMPDERRNQIVNHLQTYFTKHHDAINKLCSIHFEEISDFKLQYISSQLPCPLLNVETNECIAYEIRPLPCRTYLNYCNPIVCKDDFIPSEPFSYEFLRDYYIEALNELVQTILYEDHDDYGIQYPDDVFQVDYLPTLLKNEQFMKKAK
ncbi:YkgJ family cysteine cluster protein [Schinkia azotoformans]|uniref:YkgJ family cysteine cluster protein n=1 Tax=Schinkia azotoformans TaxID=1454 RepID=UPI002E2333CE|nr:YkgJ family cysteine cluster protein [Schinkia azotoformans]